MNYYTCPECGNIVEVPDRGLVFHACPHEKYQSADEIFASFQVFDEPYIVKGLNMMHIEGARWRPVEGKSDRVELAVRWKDGKEETYEVEKSIALEVIEKIKSFRNETPL